MDEQVDACLNPMKQVGPGEEQDVVLPLIAPYAAGMYEAHFRLVDRDTGRRLGQRFPIIAEVVRAPAVPWNPNMEETDS